MKNLPLPDILFSFVCSSDSDLNIKLPSFDIPSSEDTVKSFALAVKLLFCNTNILASEIPVPSWFVTIPSIVNEPVPLGYHRLLLGYLYSIYLHLRLMKNLLVLLNHIVVNLYLPYLCLHQWFHYL